MAHDASLRKRYGLTAESANLIVSTGNSDSFLKLMKTLVLAHDLDSALAVSTALIAFDVPRSLRGDVAQSMPHVFSAWSFSGSDEEKAFAADWHNAWGATPKKALNALSYMLSPTISASLLDFDVDSALGLIEMAAPLCKSHKGVAGVFSEVFEHLLLKSLPNAVKSIAIDEHEGAQVFKAILAIDPAVMFQPQTSSPIFDLTKRRADAHPDSAEGLTFDVSHHNLVDSVLGNRPGLNNFNPGKQLIPSWLEAIEEVYSNGPLLHAEAALAMKKIHVAPRSGFGAQIEPLLRGWLSPRAVKELYDAEVHHDLMKGRHQILEAVPFPVSLAHASAYDANESILIVKALVKSGVDLDARFNHVARDHQYSATLVHHVVMHGSVDFLGALMNMGIDRHARMYKEGLPKESPVASVDPLELAILHRSRLSDENPLENMDQKTRLDTMAAMFRSYDARVAANQAIKDMGLTTGPI